MDANLEWKVVDQYHAATTCGRYTVSRAGNGPGHFVYTAWRGRVLLANVAAVDENEDRRRAIAECKAVCGEDAAEAARAAGDAAKAGA